VVEYILDDVVLLDELPIVDEEDGLRCFHRHTNILIYIVKMAKTANF